MMFRYAVFFPLAVCALAHDLYLMPAKFTTSVGDKLVISVHNGDAFPNSEGTTDPLRIRDAKLSDGTPVHDFRTLGRATHGIVEIRRKGCLNVSLHTEPKFLEMAADKFEAYLREEGLDQVLEYRRAHGEGGRPGREMYAKFARSLIVADAPDGDFAPAPELTIEIVPQANPSLLTPGEMLPVKVLFRGKPLAGVQLERAWVEDARGRYEVVGRTDESGQIRVPIHTAGKWRLHAMTMERYPDPSVADWHSYWASLTFEVNATRSAK